MATIWAIPPGTGSSGAGTEPSPYTGIHDALNALFEEAAGSILKIKTGVLTLGMDWNTITWGTGTLAAPYIIEPETFAPDTTRGVPVGTTSVIWRVANGKAALNFGVSGPGHIAVRGIVLDAPNATTDGAGGSTNYVVLNHAAHHIEFRNCLQSNRSQTAGQQVVGFALANSNKSTALLHNAIRFCRFATAHAASSHDIYMRSSGNILEFNDFNSNTGRCAIQLFASDSLAGGSINDNTIRYNEMHDYGNVGANLASILFSLNCNRNKVYRNLIHGSPTRIGVDLRGGSGITGAADSNEIHSNTIVGCLKGISVGTNDPNFPNTSVKNNIAFGNGSSASDNYVDNGTSTVTATNSFDGTNPQFTNPGSDDYTLSASTPDAIRINGTSLGSPEDDQDYVGAVIDPDNVAVGAYQFAGAPVPEAPINEYPAGGFAVEVDATVQMVGVSVTDNNSPKLLTEAWLYADQGGTFTSVTPGAATSVENP